MLCVRRCETGPAGRVSVVVKVSTLQYMYIAESPKQGSKRFNSIMKTILFAHIGCSIRIPVFYKNVNNDYI